MKVLFCGLGGIGQRHLRNLHALLDGKLDVHAYRVRRNRTKLLDNLTVEAGADLETDYGIHVHGDLGDALAAAPEVVFVCNPSSMHTEIALAAANAGSHLFIEKPVASNLKQLAKLQAAVEQRRLVCYVGYNMRFHPALRRMKSLVASRHFGNIISVQAVVGEHLPSWHKYEDYREMYASREALGGGVILSQIHEMDLLYWFFGLPRSILCRGGKLSSLEINVEDTASSLMQYDGEHGRFPITLHQDFLQRPPVRTFNIVGDQGIARLDLIANRLQVFAADGSSVEDETYSQFERNDMFIDQMRHFLDCLNGSATPLVNLNDGVQSLRLALAAKSSLASNLEVAIDGIN